MLTSSQCLQPIRMDERKPGSTRDFQTLPPQQFQALLTLFSKFFSSFPRGTCSLSVSCQYLALDGIYHQIRAAFSNNPTLGKHAVMKPKPGLRGSHPLKRSIPGNLGKDGLRQYFYRLQFASRGLEIFKLGLSRFTRRY